VEFNILKSSRNERKKKGKISIDKSNLINTNLKNVDPRFRRFIKSHG
jgi:hypothetical protein